MLPKQANERNVMSSFKRNSVVVPIDFSEESYAAVDGALDITGDASKIHIVHVLEELSPVHPGELYGSVDDETRTNHSTDALTKQFGGDKYAGLSIKITHGAPGARIADYADSVGADLIVMPSHGRTGIAHMLIGSVTERTIRHAKCPVLVLRK